MRPTSRGTYTTTVPDMGAFSVANEGDGLVFAVSGLLGLAAVRRRQRGSTQGDMPCH